jgi:hypothetical protein
MQKVDYNQKVKVENQKLQQQLSRERRDLDEKSEKVDIMQARFVKFNLDTPKYFLDAYQGFNMEEKYNFMNST